MLSIGHLNKTWNDVVAIDDISFDIPDCQIVLDHWPIRWGKSTLLRCIAGLEKFEGAIEFDGRPLRHEIGMVFQNFNLFNNMSVLRNLTYGPTHVLKVSMEEAVVAAHTYMDKTGISELANKYPSALSGGQKQRVAIARALCMNSKVLLCDEPTSALDPENVGEVFKVIKELRALDITVVIVTHSMTFARNISDRVLFIDKGHLICDAPPIEVFEKHDNPRIDAFFKKMMI